MNQKRVKKGRERRAKEEVEGNSDLRRQCTKIPQIVFLKTSNKLRKIGRKFRKILNKVEKSETNWKTS